MAHTYVIQSVVSVGDVCTITGTVDGIPVTVNCWLSALGKFATAVLAQQFMCGLMLPVAFPAASTPQVQYQGQVIM